LLDNPVPAFVDICLPFISPILITFLNNYFDC
jgi:hypothetical protein